MGKRNGGLFQPEEVPTFRPRLHQMIDRHLNTEGAAATMQAWSDKMRGLQPREWATLPEATKELYRLLTYEVMEKLSGDDPVGLLDTIMAIRGMSLVTKARKAA